MDKLHTNRLLKEVEESLNEWKLNSRRNNMNKSTTANVGLLPENHYRVFEQPEHLVSVHEGITYGYIPVSFESVMRWHDENVFPGLIEVMETKGSGYRYKAFFWNTLVWEDIVNSN